MFAVIDFETTGINPFRHDRVVEVAVVVADGRGQILREFDSLINPQRDVGPTRIHGLYARDLVNAPNFEDVLPYMLEVMEGTTAIVGHNLRFDISFLQCEFDRIGLSLPDFIPLCTMQLAGGGSLATVCGQFGIDLTERMHSALADARAAARLFDSIVNDEPAVLRDSHAWKPILWPKLLKNPCQPIRREDCKANAQHKLSFLQRIASKMDPEPELDSRQGAILAYSTLLAQVLEDRIVDERECEALVGLASKWELSDQQVAEIHRDFLRRVQVAALADGVVTEEERQDVHAVARLLGIKSFNIDEQMHQAAVQLSMVNRPGPDADASELADLKGKSICFTGELESCWAGIPITREMAMAIAESNGMLPVCSVTKKLDLLVAADICTLSGKAQKARKYGIPIWSEKQFMALFGREANT